MRLGLATLLVTLLTPGAIASCGKDSGGAAAPRTTPAPRDPDSGATEGVGEATDGDEADGSGEGKDPAAERRRVPLVTEFHRTRFGPDTSFWVLGVVHNSQPRRVTDVRVHVRLLDGEDQDVAEGEGRIRRTLEPGERAGVAVLVPEPAAHEQLVLNASAAVDTGPEPEPPPLRLEHEDPQRAEFGGWFVVGRVENTGTEAVEGARLEIQGLDEGGKLLGIDWLALDPIAAGEAIEFDVGDLRYEEQPAGFSIQLRGPALD